MNQIFLSYSRTDQPFALKLTADLHKAGIDVWIDRHDIAPAENWDEEIQRGLDASKGLVILISHASVNSANVLNEINYALERKKQVWPVLIEKHIIKPLNINRLQHIDFTDDYEAGLKQLIPSLQNTPFLAPTTKKEKKYQWVIALVATAIIIAVSLFFMRGTFSSGVQATRDSIPSNSANNQTLNGSWITEEITNPFDENDRYTLQFNISTIDSSLSGKIESRSTENGKGYHTGKAFSGGKINGHTFSFYTLEESFQGSEKFRYKNYYTGVMVNNELQITLSSDRPWEFPEQHLVAKPAGK